MLKNLINMSPHKAILISPLIFFIHFYFEEAPYFEDWIYRITNIHLPEGLFFQANLNGLSITVTLALLVYFGSNVEWTILPGIMWLSFTMFANPIFHLTSTVVNAMYSPGAITSATLSLPYFIWFIWLSIKHTKTQHTKIKLCLVILSIILGSIPMFLMTYPLVFEGRLWFAK